MAPSVTVRYTPTRQDYAAVLRLFFWQRLSTRISLAFLLVTFILVLISLVTAGTSPSIFELIWLLLPPLFVIYVLLVQPWQMAGQAIKNEQLRSEATWEVSDAGVQISNPFGSNLMEWQGIKKLVTGREYYLLLSSTNKNTFRFLPRRAFITPADQELFLELVAKNLAGKQQPA